MHSKRDRQVKIYHGSGLILQDAELIEFVRDKQIRRITFDHPQSQDFFSCSLEDLEVSKEFFHDDFLCAVIRPYPYVYWEEFLEYLIRTTCCYRPRWLYVAVNQYAVCTRTTWSDLTDDYAGDLLNSISSVLGDYHEITRNAPIDLGQTFNFVHPTTHAYYQRSSR